MGRNLSRRDFFISVTAMAGSIMGVVIGIPVIGYLISPALASQKSDAWVPVGKLENYPVDEPTPFSFTRTKVNGWEKTVDSISVFVLRSQDNRIKVMSGVCTHLGCRVSWNKGMQQYACPCHDGNFDRDGNVISGPPPRPLDQYETKVENGSLSIHLLQA